MEEKGKTGLLVIDKTHFVECVITGEAVQITS